MYSRLAVLSSVPISVGDGAPITLIESPAHATSISTAPRVPRLRHQQHRWHVPISAVWQTLFLVDFFGPIWLRHRDEPVFRLYI